MNLFDIAVAGVRRQKAKKAFLVIALALGSATVVSLFTTVNSQRATIERQFDEYGANIVILPETDNLSLTYGGINVSGVVTRYREIPLGQVNNIWQIPNKANIRAVSPKLLASTLVQSGAREAEALVVGALFEQEMKIRPWWEIEGGMPSGDHQVLVGAEVAAKLDLAVDRIIAIRGEEFRVTGVLAATGSQDDNVILVDFDTMAVLFDKAGKVSIVEVSALCSDCPIETIISQISHVLPGARINGIRQVMQQKMQSIKQLSGFTAAVTAIIVFLGSVLVFTSMMGSVAERTHEIGVFRAIGYRRGNIVSIILIEALGLSLIAGIGGTLLGIAVSRALVPFLFGAGESVAPVSLDPTLLAVCTPSVVLLAILASIRPALKAAGTDPVVALRSL